MQVNQIENNILDEDDKYLNELDKQSIEFSWKARFDSKFVYKPSPFTVPRFKDAIKLIPTAIR
jgi:hypothetical protein